MKNCPFCNSQIENNAKFCTECGKSLDNAQQAGGMSYMNETGSTPVGSPYQAQPAGAQGQPYQAQPAGVQGQPYQAQPSGVQSQPYQAQPAGVQAQPYQAQPAGVQAQPYQAQPAGVQGQPYQAQPAGAQGQPYQAQPAGVQSQPYQAQPSGVQGQPYQSNFAPAQGAGMNGAAAPQPKKKKSLLPFFIIGGVVLAAIITVVVLYFTGIIGGGGDVDETKLGKWIAVSAEYDGTSISIEDVVEVFEGEVVLNLKERGKCDVIMGGLWETTGTWSLDGKKFTLKYDGTEYAGTFKNDEIHLEIAPYTFVFTQNGKKSTATTATTVVPTVSAGSTDEDNDISGSENTEVYGDPPYGGDEAFSSPTKKISYPSKWYGYMRFDNVSGSISELGDGYTEDVWAIFNFEGDRPYFEIFEGDPDEMTKDERDEALLLTMYVKENPDALEPDVTNGTKDAWFINVYLTEEVNKDMDTTLRNGCLDIWMYYDDGESSSQVTFYLREWGMPWDENGEELPPDYDINYADFY